MERVPGAARWLVDFRAVSESNVGERLLREELIIDEVLKGVVKQVLSENNPSVLTPWLLMGILTAETYLRQVAGMAGVNRFWLSSRDQDTPVIRNGSFVD